MSTPSRDEVRKAFPHLAELHDAEQEDRRTLLSPPSSGPARSLREAFQQVLGEDVDRRLTARAEAARTALSQIRAQQALREAARINAAADAEKEAEAAAEE